MLKSICDESTHSWSMSFKHKSFKTDYIYQASLDIYGILDIYMPFRQPPEKSGKLRLSKHNQKLAIPTS